MKKLLAILFVLSITPLFADMIYLTNGFSVQGDIISVSGDTTVIKTKGPDAKEIKIATAQILRTEKEKVETNIVGTSLKNVGFGCLGGVSGALIGVTIVILANAFDSTPLSAVIISGLTIAGILIGVNLGGK